MLIASRNGFAVKFPITAKNYVQSGLVAMWDGIENAGWGVHDNNATTWPSLVGNDSLSVVGGADGWGADHFKLLGSNAHFANGEVSFRPTDIATWELCCIVRDTSVGGRFYGWNLPNGNVNYCDNGLTSFDSTRHFYYRGSGIAATASNLNRVNPPLGEMVTSALVMSGGVTSVTLSGNMVYSVSGTPSTAAGLIFAIGGGSDGKYGVIADIFCLRAYSRALTAAEVAANYAVDKIRFNLP